MTSYKRIREDGQISKHDYDKDVISSNSNNNSEHFPVADASVLANRRIVSANKQNKKQLVNHISLLNKSLKSYVDSHINCELIDAVSDYIDYMNDLIERYCKVYGEVLTFGSGDCGQLGHGDDDDVLTIRYPKIVFSLRDKRVCGISCGGLHNAAYTETGQVYTWGCNDDGSLGRTGEEQTPSIVEGLLSESIIGVSCGDGQTLAITASGAVWGWGCFKDKEGNKWFNPSINCNRSAVPYNDIKKQQNTPIQISGLSHIAELSSGSGFSLARSDSGEVYSWGIGECGELGRDTIVLKDGRSMSESTYLSTVLSNHLTPGPIYLSDGKIVKDVTSVGCGAYHSLIVTVGGGLFTCGLNNYGQLGLKDSVSRDRLHRVEKLDSSKILSAKGGMHHSLALTSDGLLFTWGRSDYCQLGIKTSKPAGDAGDFTNYPVKPELNDTIIQISCGSNHNLALSKSNKVYTWGYGDMSALGHGVDRDEVVPKAIDTTKLGNITITQVSGGGQHSAIIGQVVRSNR